MGRKLAHPNGLRIAAILLCFAAAGCSSYRRIAPPEPGTSYASGTAARITLESGDRLRVDGLSVASDSVRGMRAGHTYVTPRDSVSAYEVSRIDPLKTTIHVVAIAAVVFGFLALTWNSFE